jgi:hypothetical protein
MLDIRQIEWVSTRWKDRLNPIYWRNRSRQIRAAGAVADWLHNLTGFSAQDFEEFDEEWFWREYGWMRSRLRFSCFNYKSLFERCLAQAFKNDLGIESSPLK